MKNISQGYRCTDYVTATFPPLIEWEQKQHTDEEKIELVIGRAIGNTLGPEILTCGAAPDSGDGAWPRYELDKELELARCCMIE